MSDCTKNLPSAKARNVGQKRHDFALLNLTEKFQILMHLFCRFLQGDHEGADGLVKSGQIPSLQHKATTNFGTWNSAPSNAFFPNHSRLWLAGNCGRPNRSTGN